MNNGIDMGTAPLIEMVGNRCVTVEGCAGILHYEDTSIKLSVRRMLISFSGRGLRVRCISGSCVEVEGFINKIEFVC